MSRHRLLWQRLTKARKEVDRLRAENERLRVALTRIALDNDPLHRSPTCKHIARTALRETTL